MDSEFDKIDVCANCKIKDFCDQYPDDQYTCEDVMILAGVLDYQNASDMEEYCKHYEPTYNPETELS